MLTCMDMHRTAVAVLETWPRAAAHYNRSKLSQTDVTRHLLREPEPFEPDVVSAALKFLKKNGHISQTGHTQEEGPIYQPVPLHHEHLARARAFRRMLSVSDSTAQMLALIESDLPQFVRWHVWPHEFRALADRGGRWLDFRVRPGSARWWLFWHDTQRWNRIGQVGYPEAHSAMEVAMRALKGGHLQPAT